MFTMDVALVQKQILKQTTSEVKSLGELLTAVTDFERELGLCISQLLPVPLQYTDL